MTTIDTDKLARIRLSTGSHPAPTGPDDEMCIMEALAYVRGIPHTDHPACVSTYLGAFGRTLNDRLPDDARQQLVRLIPLLPGTAEDGLDERRRWIAADYSMRVLAPKWLDRAGLTGHAETLRSLPPIVNRDTYNGAYSAASAARDAAWELRCQRFDTIRARVRGALAERPDAVAAAVAVAVANAVAAAVAATDADAVAAAVAVAVAAAAAVAVAVAVAAADADADAAAVAAAAAAAVAAAAAAADADAAVDAAVAAAVAAVGEDERYWAVRDAVYAKVRTLYEERYADLIAECRAEAIDLYERLIRCDEPAARG